MRRQWPPVTDQDLQPGAYLCQDDRLYEITAVNATTVTLENCVTGGTLSTDRTSLTRRGSTYGLVKPAPSTTVPDTVPDFAEVEN